MSFRTASIRCGHGMPFGDRYREATYCAGSINAFSFYSRRFIGQQEEIDDYNRAMYAAWRQINSDADSPGYITDNVRSTRAYLADVIGAEERLRKLDDEVGKSFKESDQ